MEPATDTRAEATIARSTVADLMTRGVHSAGPETPLRTIAATMARHSIHCVVVSDLDGVGERAWGVVSELDLVRAATEDPDGLTAGAIAATELVTVSPSDPLERAAQLMAEHEVTHLLAVENGHPVGVISALDIASAIAA